MSSTRCDARFRFRLGRVLVAVGEWGHQSERSESTRTENAEARIDQVHVVDT
jgi:hypothetical protein